MNSRPRSAIREDINLARVVSVPNEQKKIGDNILSNSNLQMDQPTSDDEQYRAQLKINKNREAENRQLLIKRVTQIVVDLIVIIIIFVAFILVYLFLEPKILYFTCDQSDVFMPFIEDTVPFWAVGIYATIGPMIFILFVELFTTKVVSFKTKSTTPDCNIKRNERLKNYAICVFHALSLFILGISITLLLTEIGKKWIGRLRPHFISVCQPILTQLNCLVQGVTGSTYRAISTGDSFCTGDAKKIKEARLSFPSGHSSYSCYCMTFLIVYLEARLILLRLRYLKPLIQMTAFIAAYVTCVSRISDYHHRGSDVIGGAVLGISIALFITFIIGRVLWEYNVECSYSDFDLKIQAKKAKNQKPAAYNNMPAQIITSAATRHTRQF